MAHILEINNVVLSGCNNEVILFLNRIIFTSGKQFLFKLLFLIIFSNQDGGNFF